MSDRKTMERYIDESAKCAAREVLNLQRQRRGVNLYGAMERLLRAYPKLKRMCEHPEEYQFLPAGRSKGISVAPPAGSGVRDPMDALDEHIDSRAASFDRTAARYTEIDAVVREFLDRPEFVVIRMYYWNEDAHGRERGDDEPRWSMNGIQEALSMEGIDRDVRTIRRWRSRIVQDMTVLMFGVDGAVSLEESRERQEGQ